MNFSRLIKSCSIPSRWLLANNIRYQSSSAAQNLIQVDINEKTGVSVVSLNRKPVNSLSLELFKDFCGVMDDLEREKVRGMVLKSVSTSINLIDSVYYLCIIMLQSCDNVFSSGLDITELYPNPSEERFEAFWLWFQESWLKLYGSSFPTVAFVNGMTN